MFCFVLFCWKGYCKLLDVCGLTITPGMEIREGEGCMVQPLVKNIIEGLSHGDVFHQYQSFYFIKCSLFINRERFNLHYFFRQTFSVICRML